MKIKYTLKDTKINTWWNSKTKCRSHSLKIQRIHVEDALMLVRSVCLKVRSVSFPR